MFYTVNEDNKYKILEVKTSNWIVGSPLEWTAMKMQSMSANEEMREF